MKKLFIICFFALFFSLLFYADKTKSYAFLGLDIWYKHMLPALLPFMILSGLLIRLKLDKILIKPVSFLLKPVFRVSDAGIYTMFIGFLCGFPMGARIAAMEYKEQNISQKEAEYLLAFCNNFGPAYYFSFVCGNIYPKSYQTAGLILLYALPLLYGLFLRYTVYRKESFQTDIPTVEKEKSKPYTVSVRLIIRELNFNIINSLSQIGILGGYMIVCNILMVPVFAVLSRLGLPMLQRTLQPILHGLLEISGGLLTVGKMHIKNYAMFFLSHILLAFNGLSCHLQTFQQFDGCPFSKKKYMLHKINLCSMVCIAEFIMWKYVYSSSF